MSKRYFYENVIVTKIVDGDTIDVNIDLGFHTWKFARIRFLGMNAPEIKGVERPQGLESKEFLSKLIPVDSEVKFDCKGQDKYGRWLGVIYKEIKDEEGNVKDLDVNNYMVESGHAVIY